MTQKKNTPTAMSTPPPGFLEYQGSLIATWLACAKCASTFEVYPVGIQCYEKVLSHDPSNTSALKGLSSLLRISDVNHSQVQGSFHAINLLSRALSMYDSLRTNSSIWAELAECHLITGNVSEAHNALERGLSMAPRDPSLWLLSGQALARSGSVAQATEALTNSLRELPHSQLDGKQSDIARAAHAELAAVAAGNGDIASAIRELRITLSLPAPAQNRVEEHAALWCALATALERSGNLNGAIRACKDSERAMGSHPRILITHAFLLLLQGSPFFNPNEAITLLKKVVAKEKRGNSDSDAHTPSEGADFLPWFLLAKAHTFVGSPLEAYDCYHVALTRAPTCPVPWLAVGSLYLESGQLADALSAYTQAVRMPQAENSAAVIASATAWEGLAAVYERCDNQAHDASDACLRASEMQRAAGDVRASSHFEQRAHALIAAANKKAPPPPLRPAPHVPSRLLRDLVPLSPAERVELMKSKPHQNFSSPANGHVQDGTNAKHPHDAGWRQVPQSAPPFAVWR